MEITVMRGGPSGEREVSLRSGASVAQALRSLGHQVHELDPQTPDWRLPDSTEVVFLALHGAYGEDGTVQQQLESLHVPYTGCGPEASRIAFDKVLTKERCLAAGVLTPRYFVAEDRHTALPADWQPPLVLKPVREGSSLGLEFVERAEEWPVALARSFDQGRPVVVEEKIVGRELTAGILDGEALPLVEVRPKQGAYDYANKYTTGATDYLCPAPFAPAETAGIQRAALAAFAAIGGGDYARIDLMISRAGEPLVLEINTLPGMTETSLLPKAAAAAGLSYAQLCERMVELALRRAGRRPQA